VIDLCKPTQRKYETAVSGILGRNIDAAIVDEEKIAIECIHVCVLFSFFDSDCETTSSYSTYAPNELAKRDTINTKPINDEFRLFAKGARLAVDAVQYESTVERAMLHAYGNALVCDTMEVARCVCWKRRQEVNGMLLLFLLEVGYGNGWTSFVQLLH
jgi:structural maintenance of chromosome 1